MHSANCKARSCGRMSYVCDRDGDEARDRAESGDAVLGRRQRAPFPNPHQGLLWGLGDRSSLFADLNVRYRQSDQLKTFQL